jgi:hypothetical protein
MERQPGMSTIEFRCLDSNTAVSPARTAGTPVTGGLKVQVVVDGKTLESRWNSRGKWNNSVPLCTWPSDGVTPFDLWSTSFAPSAYDGELLSEDGRVAVLTCGCGELMCGGVVARIDFTDETVTWSDFVHANYLTPQNLDSFVFSRDQYDQALAEVQAHDHG